MSEPVFWLIAGPNGAGKTTLVHQPRFQRLLAGVRFFNPDETTLRLLQGAGYAGFQDAPHDELRRCFIAAATEVEAELQSSLLRGEAVGVETVLSTRKYCRLVEQVIGRNGFVGLIYIALRDAELSQIRVARRVAQGGHNVPADKLVSRWQGSLSNLGWFAKRATRFWVVDNSDSTPGVAPRLLATGGGGTLEILSPLAIPQVTEILRTSL